MEEQIMRLIAALHLYGEHVRSPNADTNANGETSEKPMPALYRTQENITLFVFDVIRPYDAFVKNGGKRPTRKK